MLNAIAFITSLLLAGIAAYFSVIGISTIFAGAFWSIVVMAGALEIGKLVTAAWLHIRWEEVGVLMRSYLTTAVVVLMLITSMGIFGYLSKSHLEQSASTTTISTQQEYIQKQINREQRVVDSVDAQLSSLDEALNEYIERGYVTRGLEAREAQKDERTSLQAQQDESLDKIASLQEEMFGLQQQQNEIEAEIGPLKYIAELIYGDEAEAHFDDAVRLLIITLIFVFDPLAVLLLIASTGMMAKEEDGPFVVSGDINFSENLANDPDAWWDERDMDGYEPAEATDPLNEHDEDTVVLNKDDVYNIEKRDILPRD